MGSVSFSAVCGHKPQATSHKRVTTSHKEENPKPTASIIQKALRDDETGKQRQVDCAGNGNTIASLWCKTLQEIIMILPRMVGVIGVLLPSPKNHPPPIRMHQQKASSLLVLLDPCIRDPSLSCLYAVPTTSDSDDNVHPDKENKEPANKLPQSRLARLAEDWLEEKEEDELLKYWERFEEKTTQPVPKNTEEKETTDKDDSTLTTQERLERYLDSRGIRRGEELTHRDKIEASIVAAQTAITAEDALKALETVQPWLQVNTRLGGIALVEYLTARWQKDGKLDEELCRALLTNPHNVVVSKVKNLLKCKNPPSRQPSLWTGIFSKGGTEGNVWWW